MQQMQQAADRVNFRIFQGMQPGSSVRVAGHFGEVTGQHRALATTDGGSIPTVPEPQDDLSAFTGNVEVVGTKASDSTLHVVAVLPLPGDMDPGLWDDCVNLCHEPQLQHLF